MSGHDAAHERRVGRQRRRERHPRPYGRLEPHRDQLRRCKVLARFPATMRLVLRAIAAQPQNIQFYARRALVRLALGRVAEARADVDHAIASAPAGDPYNVCRPISARR